MKRAKVEKHNLHLIDLEFSEKNLHLFLPPKSKIYYFKKQLHQLNWYKYVYVKNSDILLVQMMQKPSNQQLLYFKSNNFKF